MKVKVLGKIWRLRFAPNLANRGDCDDPDRPGKEIRIASTLRGGERLEVQPRSCNARKQSGGSRGTSLELRAETRLSVRVSRRRSVAHCT